MPSETRHFGRETVAAEDTKNGGIWAGRVIIVQTQNMQMTRIPTPFKSTLAALCEAALTRYYAPAV